MGAHYLCNTRKTPDNVNFQVLISQERAPQLLPEYHTQAEKQEISIKDHPAPLPGRAACAHGVMQIGFNLLHVFLLPSNLWRKMGLSLLLAVNSCASKHSGQGGTCRGEMRAGAAPWENTKGEPPAALLRECPRCPRGCSSV